MRAENWRPLFFSGGTALRELAQEMSTRRIHSVHIVTTFDSGGSTARLRDSFAMPAVGDLRNRLLALADRRILSPAVLELFDARLPLGISRAEAQNLFVKLLENSRNWQGMPEETAELLRHSLQIFRERMPGGFNACGASIGNLLLAGTYLENGRDLGAAISLFSAVLHIHGAVFPLCDSSLNLGAILANGEIIADQHLFHQIPAPIKDIFLAVGHDNSYDHLIACEPPPSPGILEEIGRASLLCLPMGSFFSSVLPHLLTAGVADAIQKSSAPKVFIPNSGHDPELREIDLWAQVRHILRHAASANQSAGKMLDYVLVDKSCGQYQVADWRDLEARLDAIGIVLVDRNIVDCENARRHLPKALLEALAALNRENQRP